MRRTLTFPLQIIISLLVGMGLSFISVKAFPSTLPPQTPKLTPVVTVTPMPIVTSLPLIPTQISAETPKPYVTISGVWLVRVQFSSNNVPQVLKVTKLEKGRITPFSQGSYQAELLDDAGGVLFTGRFVISFVRGDPPHAVEQVTTILVLPVVEKAVQIRIKAPQGETIYDIQP